jgi:hypothetical protein
MALQQLHTVLRPLLLRTAATANGKMKKTFLILPLIVLVVALVACDRSGTWDDDPHNWTRAFNSEKPNDVNVIHSKYWRSSYWTNEYQSFFEIENNEKLRAQLFSENSFIIIEDKEAEKAMLNYFGKKPEWFIPGKTADYNIYVYEKQLRGNFRVYINKRSGKIYLTDYQV